MEPRPYEGAGWGAPTQAVTAEAGGGRYTPSFERRSCSTGKKWLTAGT